MVAQGDDIGYLQLASHSFGHLLGCWREAEGDGEYRPYRQRARPFCGSPSATFGMVRRARRREKHRWLVKGRRTACAKSAAEKLGILESGFCLQKSVRIP
jgi:hypothetical protein